MRRGLTEREVYKKLLVLEKHSSFKQPYKYQSHPIAELTYEYPGYPQWPIPPGSGSYPDWPPGPNPDCEFACNPSMLDCSGGCTQVSCICGPIAQATVESDPTGSAQVSIYGNYAVVCINDSNCDVGSSNEYPYILLKLTSVVGEIRTVEVAVVDCRCCCEEFTLTGDDTVGNGLGATWTGTISPACPGATAEVTSNSGCDLTAIVNGAGSQVLVNTTGACGQMIVTVTGPDGNCTAYSDSKGVRIAGGSWGNWTLCCQVGDLCDTCCGSDWLCNLCGEGWTYTAAQIIETEDGQFYRLGEGGVGDPTCAGPTGSRPCDSSGEYRSCAPIGATGDPCEENNVYTYNYSSCDWSCEC